MCFCLLLGDHLTFLRWSPCVVSYLAAISHRLTRIFPYPMCSRRCIYLFQVAAIALTLVFIGLLDRTQTALHLSALFQQVGIAEVGSRGNLMRIR